MCRVNAKNHLYDRVTGDIAPQLGRLGELIASARSCPGDEAAQSVALSRICVLGAYIKRRSNLILLSEDAPDIPAMELYYCLRESADNLEAAGVACSCRADCRGRLGTREALMLYDLFEAATETAFTTLRAARCGDRPCKEQRDRRAAYERAA